MSDPPPNKPPVVLVVDDEALLRMLATDYFEEAGYEVLEADNAEAALRLLKARPDIRAVMTDVQMPGELDGYDVARSARSAYPDCAIVVVSGREMPRPSDLAQGIRFIAKPYRGEAVVGLLDELLGR